MIRKAIGFTVFAAGLAVAANWTDIQRYLKIKQMSGHGMHPENVPVEGHTAYPSRAADAVRDGTGDFDSASRGGPALA
ncbi:MAG TPA: hypothetical protein VMR14_20390 [Streptosporangiaceae bacterium]|jgi:hypothetical protein|nr:hypothetical protein [Streptosporangiaceae bacterium]